MRILCLFFCALFCVKLSYADSTLNRSMDLLANALALAHTYVQTNFSRAGFDLSSSVVSDLLSGNYLIQSASVDNNSGAISLTLGTNPAVSSQIRGLVLTLTPQYINSNSGALEGFNRNSDLENHHIDTWVCSLNNSAAGENFVVANIFGHTSNILGSADAGNADLENVLSRYCSKVSITTGG